MLIKTKHMGAGGSRGPVCDDKCMEDIAEKVVAMEPRGPVCDDECMRNIADKVVAMRASGSSGPRRPVCDENCMKDIADEVADMPQFVALASFADQQKYDYLEDKLGSLDDDVTSLENSLDAFVNKDDASQYLTTGTGQLCIDSDTCLTREDIQALKSLRDKGELDGRYVRQNTPYPLNVKSHGTRGNEKVYQMSYWNRTGDQPGWPERNGQVDCSAASHKCVVFGNNPSWSSGTV